MPVISRRTLDSQGQIVPVQPGGTTPDVSEMAGSPLEMPGVVAGAFGRIAKLSAADLGELQELLGKPIQLGKRLVRLSSADPAKGIAILHDATSGERVATPIKDFLDSWRSIGEDTAEPFPEGSVLSQRGMRADGGTIGPRGGLNPLRRSIPPTATK